MHRLFGAHTYPALSQFYGQTQSAAMKGAVERQLSVFTGGWVGGKTVTQLYGRVTDVENPFVRAGCALLHNDGVDGGTNLCELLALIRPSCLHLSWTPPDRKCSLLCCCTVLYTRRAARENDMCNQDHECSDSSSGSV